MYRRLSSMVMIYLTCIFFLGGLGHVPTVFAQGTPAEAYAGKRITFIVPFGPGGGYGTTARVFAPFLEKHTGAKVMIRNITGAGGLNGMNALYRSDADGYTIGLVTGIGAVLNQIAGSKGVRFQTKDFTWLGGVSPNFFAVAALPTGPFKDMNAVMNSKRPVKIGTTGAGSALTVAGRMLAKAYGFDVHFVPGYGSTGEIFLGVMRGDIDLAISSADSVLSQAKGGTLVPILYMDMKKSPLFPDTPSFNEIKMPKEDLIYARAISNLGEMGRILAGPPGIDKEKVLYLQKAVWQTLTDPEFVKAARKVNQNVEPATAERVAEMVQEALNSPPGIKDVIKEAFKK